MKQKLSVKYYDFRLVVYLLAISTIGILAIGSAKESVQSRQIMGLALGIFLMVVISLFDYGVILKLYWLIYLGNLGLLLLVKFFGDSSNNAQRWIELAGIRFQPSESAKIFLILFFAQFIMKRKENLNTFKTIIEMVLLFFPVFLLIYKQPDLSTSIMVILIFCMVLYVGGLSHKVIFGTLAAVIPAAVIVFFLILQPDQQLINEYQQKRILAWLQPDKYSLTTAYQQQNSITAIGSGKLWGKGLNNNEVGSVKNGNYISEPQTDFIFAIIGEEMGFAGTATTIVLLMMIAQVSGLKAGTLIHVIADAHIYDRHIDLVKEVIAKPQHPAPILKIDPNVKDFYDFTLDSFELIGYEYEALDKKIPVAI